jgi:hypothetical protein
MNTWDFLPEFIDAFTVKLKADEKRWGDTWLKRRRAGQEERMISSTRDRFDRYLNGCQPLDHLSIIGDAYINWVREQHPEIWKEIQE